MKATTDFSPIDPDEILDLAIDFACYLSTSETVDSIVSWTCTVASSSPVPDPDPASRLSGTPAISGTLVIQTVEGCLNGAVYVMEAIVNTNLQERLSIWSYIKCVEAGVG
jgi:hypothetical protein